jgi:hypothetical protein
MAIETPQVIRSDLGSPAPYAEAVTPSDTVMLTRVSALYVGGLGTVTVLMLSGDVATFAAVPARTLLPVRCKRVNATGTTATNIVALGW